MHLFLVLAWVIKPRYRGKYVPSQNWILRAVQHLLDACVVSSEAESFTPGPMMTPTIIVAQIHLGILGETSFEIKSIARQDILLFS